jgi:NAD(P)H-dependent flavin oxidoreductase YrpB (nitropropane dioxygenase family)
MSRIARNKFVERWAAREWLLRQQQAEVMPKVMTAYKVGDINEAPLFYGQDAGLIDDIVPAEQVIRGMIEDAENILSSRLPTLLK